MFNLTHRRGMIMNRLNVVLWNGHSLGRVWSKRPCGPRSMRRSCARSPTRYDHVQTECSLSEFTFSHSVDVQLGIACASSEMWNDHHWLHHHCLQRAPRSGHGERSLNVRVLAREMGTDLSRDRRVGRGCHPHKVWIFCRRPTGPIGSFMESFAPPAR